MARDDKKNPLISTFEWTADAAQRILRVPAGFMRNQTQERVEELARERAASTIDLALVEEGIEIGKKMMAEMIATYQAPGKSPGDDGEPRGTGGSRYRTAERRRSGAAPARGESGQRERATSNAGRVRVGDPRSERRRVAVMSRIASAAPMTSGFSSTR